MPLPLPLPLGDRHVFVISLFALASVSQYVYHRLFGPPAMVRRWAEDHGFQVLQCRLCYFSSGPYTWRLSHRGVSVYRVRVQNSDGCERLGWVRCVACDFGATEWRWDEFGSNQTS